MHVGSSVPPLDLPQQLLRQSLLYILIISQDVYSLMLLSRASFSFKKIPLREFVDCNLS